MFGAAKVREVPHKQAQEFTAHMAQDQKFLRFQERMALAAQATSLRNNILTVKDKSSRIIDAKLAQASVLFKVTWPAAVVAVLAAYAPRALTAAIALALTALLIAVTRLVKDSARAEEKTSTQTLSELQSQIDELEQQMADIDKLSGEGIQIIDPSTFDPPTKDEKKKENE